MSALAIFAPARGLLRYALDLMHRKPLMVTNSGRTFLIFRPDKSRLTDQRLEAQFFGRSRLETAMRDATRLQERDCLFGAR
jgi:hypothetical protein